MRAYFFNNFYLSPIQQGIQAQHCTAEMFLKYRAQHPESRHDILHDWANNHKTTIVLNGGDDVGMNEIHALLDDPDNPYPWALFYEPGIGNALTSIGIILPEKIYEFAEELRQYRRGQTVPAPGDFTSFDFDISERLTRHGLAR